MARSQIKSSSSSSSAVIWKISATAAPELGEAIAELFQNILDVPASSFENLKRGTTEITAFLEQKQKPNWKIIKAQLDAELVRFGQLTGSSKPRLSLCRVPSEDWTESWKKHFKPIEIASALLVKPTWSNRKPKKSQATILLDPGLSFGTGQHPTTRFCLEQLVRFRPTPGERKCMLDLGCGSGILAIAAATLGYSPVEALDFDPDAVRIALQNAALNAVARKLRIRRADVARLPLNPQRKFDFICANLISTLLLGERDRIVNQLAPGGVLVLAGILKAEFNQIDRAYAQNGLKSGRTSTQTEWKSGTWIALEKF